MKTSTYFMHFVMLENMLLNDCFDTTVRTNAFKNFGHGKLGKVMESHGILKSSKKYAPCF